MFMQVDRGQHLHFGQMNCVFNRIYLYHLGLYGWVALHVPCNDQGAVSGACVSVVFNCVSKCKADRLPISSDCSHLGRRKTSILKRLSRRSTNAVCTQRAFHKCPFQYKNSTQQYCARRPYLSDLTSNGHFNYFPDFPFKKHAPKLWAVPGTRVPPTNYREWRHTAGCISKCTPSGIGFVPQAMLGLLHAEFLVRGRNPTARTPPAVFAASTHASKFC